MQFQSTLPVRGATLERENAQLKQAISIHAPRAGSDGSERIQKRVFRYFNPRSPCGERRGENCTLLRILSISIHAPRAGSDYMLLPDPHTEDYFNPRSPCGERHNYLVIVFTHDVFQSTLPVRGATELGEETKSWFIISIHAPRAGSDRKVHKRRNNDSYFNPRSPCGERLKAISACCRGVNISIHAPRAGSDFVSD